MKFENDPRIEELLNGFLDGELSTSEQAEVRRLVSKDEGVARRLQGLERCRLLMSSLPPAEPPAEVISRIKGLLRSRLAGGAGALDDTEHLRGAKHLLARQVLAAAVMMGLVGLLGAVVYRIVSPPDTAQRPVAVQTRPAVAPQALPVETKKTVAVEDKADVGLYSLRLATTDFAAVDAFVNKLLDESAALQYDVTKEPPKRSVYRVLCSKAGLSALVADLAQAWSKFDSATLVVHTGDIGQYVAVESVRPEQITDIVNQNMPEERIRLAKDFAVLNNISQITQAGKMLAFSDRTYPELTAIPKPVLTSGEKTAPAVPEGASGKFRVDLTIVVTGSTSRF